MVGSGEGLERLSVVWRAVNRERKEERRDNGFLILSSDADIKRSLEKNSRPKGWALREFQLRRNIKNKVTCLDFHKCWRHQQEDRNDKEGRPGREVEYHTPEPEVTLGALWDYLGASPGRERRWVRRDQRLRTLFSTKVLYQSRCGTHLYTWTTGVRSSIKSHGQNGRGINHEWYREPCGPSICPYPPDFPSGLPFAQHV